MKSTSTIAEGSSPFAFKPTMESLLALVFILKWHMTLRLVYWELWPMAPVAESCLHNFSPR